LQSQLEACERLCSRDHGRHNFLEAADIASVSLPAPAGGTAPFDELKDALVEVKERLVLELVMLSDEIRNVLVSTVTFVVERIDELVMLSDELTNALVERT
jgi:hypothetical protein